MIFDADALVLAIAEKVVELQGSGVDEVLTTEEAAALLKIHPTTCSELAKAGQIPARKVGREWRFSRRALLAHVSETENAALQGDV